MKIIIGVVLLSMGVMIADMSCKSSQKVVRIPYQYEVIAVNDICCKIYIQQGLDIRTINDSLRYHTKHKGDTVILWGGK